MRLEMKWYGRRDKMNAILVRPLKMENISQRNYILMKNSKKVEGFSFVIPLTGLLHLNVGRVMMMMTKHITCHSVLYVQCLPCLLWLYTHSNILQSPLEIKPTGLWIIISILLHTEARVFEDWCVITPRWCG